VAVAHAFLATPRPLLLDEPSAHLDGAGARAVNGLLAGLGALGGCALVVEQAGWRVDAGVGRWTRIAGGSLRATTAPQPPTVDGPRHAPGSAVVVAARGLRLEADGQTLLRDVDLTLHEGEVVVLTGPNGSGKSTLARAVAGHMRPVAGQVHRPGSGVALMLPVAELQLFATSVADEVSRRGTRPEELARVLRRHRLQHLAARAPWTLSRGERQRLLHAALDVLRPPVMVVDEPGQGLDPEALESMVRLIQRRAEKGRAYLVITQRPELQCMGHRRLEVCAGRVVDVGQPRS
jgi:energy-coupling factor transport system ATP-binding protein